MHRSWIYLVFEELLNRSLTVLTIKCLKFLPSNHDFFAASTPLTPLKGENLTPRSKPTNLFFVCMVFL